MTIAIGGAWTNRNVPTVTISGRRYTAYCAYNSLGYIFNADGSAASYNPLADTWTVLTATSALPAQNYYAQRACVSGNIAYIIYSDIPNGLLKVRRYNFASNTWSSEGTTFAYPGSNIVHASIIDGVVYVKTNPYTDSNILTYTPGTNAWATGPSTAGNLTANIFYMGKLYPVSSGTVGGVTGKSLMFIDASKNVVIYNIDTASWSTGAVYPGTIPLNTAEIAFVEIYNPALDLIFDYSAATNFRFYDAYNNAWATGPSFTANLQDVAFYVNKNFYLFGNSGVGAGYALTYNAPAPPEGLAVTASGWNANLTWTLPAAYENAPTSYKIYRSTDNITFNLLGTSATLSYTDVISSGAIAVYYYKITAVNGSDESNFSTTVQISRVLNPVVTASGNGTATITWTAAGGASSYNAYVSSLSGTGTGTKIAGVTSGAAFYGVNNSITDYIVITAVVGGNETLASNEVYTVPSASVAQNGMRLSRLLTIMRQNYLKDIKQPYKYSDTYLAQCLTEAQKEAVKRAKLIFDKSNPSAYILRTGMATSTVANKIVDSTAGFSSVYMGKTVYNTTNNKFATITAIDSAIQVSISADIMTSGDSYIIGDASQAIARVCVVSGTSDYSISGKVIKISDCWLNSTGLPLQQKTKYWFDKFFYQWRSAKGTPRFYIEEKGYITLVPQPNSTLNGQTGKDMLFLSVWRLPLKDLTLTDDNAPEIPEEYHYNLINWACYLVYTNDNLELGKANWHKEQFTNRFGEQISAHDEAVMRELPSDFTLDQGNIGIFYGNNP